MKKVVFIVGVAVALLINGAALFASINDAPATPLVSGNVDCYQSFGYCSSWGMDYMCLSRKTSEACRRYAVGCNLCDGGGIKLPEDEL